MGRIYGRTATELASEAAVRALGDAGLARHELDGLLINAGITRGIDLRLPHALGLERLRLGVRMSANLIDCEGHRVRAGMPVEVGFEKFDDGIATPVFRLGER